MVTADEPVRSTSKRLFEHVAPLPFPPRASGGRVITGRSQNTGGMVMT